MNIIAIHDESGERVNIGDTVLDFRGKRHTVTGFIAPKGASTGRVYVASNVSTFGQGFYPSVFGITLTVA